MFNFFKSKKTDLELIKQLEQTIGKNLPKLDKIKWRSVGYVQNEHNQITELVLYRCGLKELPPEIVNLQNLTTGKRFAPHVPASASNSPAHVVPH